MKILNLYSGIGGNRKLWGNEHKITAVEKNTHIVLYYKDKYKKDDVICLDAMFYLLENYNEFDFIWASPPCPSHSRARFWSSKPNDKVKPLYPDLSLYEMILFLDNYFDGKWVVENVIPYYEPLIKPTAKIGRHLFWANFNIGHFEPKEADIKEGNIKEWENLHGINTDGYNFGQRKDQILRNCVHPETGLHILNRALEIKTQDDITQPKLF